MTNTYAIKHPITIMRDDLIENQLPSAVRLQLGELEETGYHLNYNRRDLFYTNGTVRYVLGSRNATVEMDCK